MFKNFIIIILIFCLCSLLFQNKENVNILVKDLADAKELVDNGIGKFTNYVDDTVIPYVDKKFDEADPEKSLVGNLFDEFNDINNDNGKQVPFSVSEGETEDK